MSSKSVIYVTGSGRSGTNILKKILGSHSQIASLPFESRYLVDPRGVVDFYNTFPSLWSPYWVDWKLHDFESFLLSLSTKDPAELMYAEELRKLNPTQTLPPYLDWELDQSIPHYSRYVKDLIEELKAFSYSAKWPGTPGGIEDPEMYFASASTKAQLRPALLKFVDRCNQSICDDQEKSILVDDNTHVLLFAADVLELNSNAKIIHVMRDPRDVIASLLKQRWAPNTLSQAILWYQQIIERWYQQRAELNTNDYIEIKFEDLIHHTSTKLEEISAFAGCKVEPQMLDIDLSAHNIGRYKQAFDVSELELINRQLSEVITYFST